MSNFSKLPVSPFKTIAFNAGMIMSEFTPGSATIDRSKILFATSGGLTFNPNLQTVDLYEDIDNAKPGTMQGFKIKNCEPHLTGTVLTVGEDNVDKIMANSTVETKTGYVKVTQQDGLVDTDNFFDIWVVTDYATMTDISGTTTPGYFAIHLKNCINVTGFQAVTEKDGKTKYSVDFRAFYDDENPDEVPYEVYYSTTPLNEED